MRENLQRAYPNAAPREIERRLRDWYLEVDPPEIGSGFRGVQRLQK